MYEIVGENAAKAEVKACWDALYNRAVAILEAQWTTVEAVAAALAREGVINRNRLLAVVGSAESG